MLPMIMRRVLAATLLSLCIAQAAHAATFVVTNTTSVSTSGGCDADCSLHDAIVAANGTTAADVIEFNVSGTGVKTFTLDADGLPTITRPVTIDGYTQTGAAVNTAATGSNAVLTVALTRVTPDPINDTLTTALDFSSTATGSIVRGIAFVQMGVATVSFISTDADNMIIDGNFFGTNAPGDADGGQAPSVAISIDATANNVTIGGSTAAARNLFAGIEQGIALFGTNGLVQNNTFGLEDNGTTALALGDVGVLTSGDGHEIGGTDANEGNVFANIDSHAVQVSNTSNGNSILGNVFRNNSALGINLQAAADTGNGVTPNDFNDADVGANDLQNFPFIESATRSGTTTTVNVFMDSAPNRDYRVEIFGSDTADASGFGEGERLVAFRDITTDGNGALLFSVQVSGSGLPIGDFVTATATDTTTGETSEFSAALVVSEIFTVTSTNDATDGTCNAAHCSLREAIDAANAAPGTNRIAFGIPGAGPHVIVAGVSGFPDITTPVDLVGLSQSGAQRNTRTDASNDADRRIFLSAPAVTSLADLLVLAPGSDGSTIRDIGFKDLDADGGSMLSIESNGVSVTGCSFGLDATGNADGGNSGTSAISVSGDDNSIGGTSVGSRLQIGGVNLALLISGNGNTMTNITMGLSATGSPTVPVTGNTTVLVSGFDNIFDSVADGRNRIVGNAGKGVSIIQNRTGNRVIGTLFENNGGIAIDLESPSDPSNGITPNDTNDTDGGANNLQNHPIVTFAERNPDGTGQILGTFATNPVNGTAYRIDLFHSSTRGIFGSGQGALLLGNAAVNVNASGTTSFSFDATGLPAGGFITATASRTNAPRDTSEFSAALALSNAPLVVINTNQTGSGSLHQAILDANAQAGADRIHFAIPGVGPHRIDAGADGLPIITSQVLIDGSTQAGFVPNTATSGVNGTIRIEVAASTLSAGEHVLLIAGGGNNSRIHGLSILRSAGPGSVNGISVEGATSVDIDGNYLGVSASGNSAGTGFATALRYGTGADSANVGGSGLNLRNLFANNSNDLVIVSEDVRVQSNSFGRRRDGTISPVGAGAAIAVSGNDVEIGGPTALANAIAGHESGIVVQTGGRAAISRNVITDMTGLAIDLLPIGHNPNDPDDADTGPNDLQNHPVISLASTTGGITLVTGRLDSQPNDTHRIELFAAEENASGFAEATALIGETTVTTDANGDATFAVAVSPALVVGSKVTATATDTSGAAGATSEFSPAETVTGPDVSVNNTNDANDGTCNGTHCSLREALIAANANADPTRIRFNIPGAGPTFTITPQSALPNITQPLILDGYSQPGATANTNAVPPNNAVIRIVLDGTAIAGLGTNPAMLEVQSSDVEIRGLSIVGMDDGSNGNEGISTPTNINLVTANVRVRGNFIGLLPDGTTVDANRTGVSLGGEAPDTGNEIGGPLPEHQNIIAGSSQHGIVGSAAGLIIQNNLIGTARDGISDRGNVGNGIQLGGAFSALVLDNVIAHNDDGVVVTNSGRGVEIDPNSIHSNSALGIDLGGTGATPNDPLDTDTGANNLTNKPELVITASNGQNRTISMTLNARPSTNYFVSYYGERTCPGNGLGQGESLIDTDAHTTDAGGVVVAGKVLVLPSGFNHVTAIATDRSTGETSEFSSCAVTLTDTVFANSFE